MKRIENCRHELKYPYYVTEDGHVWSEYSQRFIAELPDRYGYLKVRLSSTDLPKGKQHAYSVHRLVLENFCPVENMEQLQVNHIDGNKRNNAVENLEWATAQENIDHAIEHGLRAKVNGGAKLSEKDVLDIIEKFKQGKLTKDIAKEYNVNRMTISRIKNRHSWQELTKDLIF